MRRRTFRFIDDAPSETSSMPVSTSGGERLAIVIYAVSTVGVAQLARIALHLIH